MGTEVKYRSRALLRLCVTCRRQSQATTRSSGAEEAQQKPPSTRRDASVCVARIPSVLRCDCMSVTAVRCTEAAR